MGLGEGASVRNLLFTCVSFGHAILRQNLLLNETILGVVLFVLVIFLLLLFGVILLFFN